MKRLAGLMRVFWTLGEDGRTPTPAKDPREWANWMPNEEARRVGLNCDHSARAFVSTVFLGIDISLVSDRPMLFQTVIFGGPHHNYQNVWATWEEAEQGHKEACELAGAIYALPNLDELAV